VTDVGPGVGKEPVSPLDPLYRVDLRGGSGVEVRRESLDLLNIKNG
jgi:hypothetical protein